MSYYEGCLPFLFLSGSHPDEDTRNFAAHTLRELGFRLNYYTAHNFTQPVLQRNWEWHARQQLMNKRLAATVALVDRAYLESDYCRAELVLTRIRKLPIVAIFTDDTPIPESYRHLFEDAICLYCDSLDRDFLATLQKLECLSSCYDSTPCVNAPEEFEAYSDVLVKYRGNSETVTVPNGFTTIGEGAFADHGEIKKLILPESVRLISYVAFYHLDSLTEIHLNEGLKNIFLDAFTHCPKLVEVRLPKTLEQISMQNFRECAALERIYVFKTMLYRPNRFTGTNAEIILI